RRRSWRGTATGRREPARARRGTAWAWELLQESRKPRQFAILRCGLKGKSSCCDRCGRRLAQRSRAAVTAQRRGGRADAGEVAAHRLSVDRVVMAEKQVANDLGRA